MVKKITVDCDFNGIIQKVPFYVGSSSSKSHPLGFQAKWLFANSGGKVSDEFMNSIAEIKEVADKHKVAFEDLLCHLMEEIEVKKQKK
tara:strand:+ start:111 stop:374 length:264 start_codon:yes stop_codon:yes gene_type:complete